MTSLPDEDTGGERQATGRPETGYEISNVAAASDCKLNTVGLGFVRPRSRPPAIISVPASYTSATSFKQANLQVVSPSPGLRNLHYALLWM